MIRQIKGIITTCKLIIWNSKYKMLDSVIKIKTLKMENMGTKLGLYLYENKKILEYVKSQSNYSEEFNNLITFLTNDEKREKLAKAIR